MSSEDISSGNADMEDIIDEIPHEYEYDREFLMSIFEQVLNDVNGWIEIVSKPYDERIVDLNFSWMYTNYKRLEFLVRKLTGELSEEQWDEVERIRSICEDLRKKYGPHLIPVDLEP